MSFQDRVERHGSALLALVDAGVPTGAAAPALGIPVRQAQEILRALGRGAGPRKVISDDQRGRVLSSFAERSNIDAAARAGGCDHKTARRILVKAGALSPVTHPVARPAAKARFAELLQTGVAPARAALQVGVTRET